MTNHFRPSMANPRLIRQRGSVLVNVAAGLSLMVILLSIIDLGFIYFHKREYQRAADLAALAGARMVRNGESAAEGAATDNAAVNLQRFTGTSATADCGTWDPAADPRFTPGECENAVEAIVIGRAPRFLPFIGELQLSASAIATAGDPLAAFSVGTRTARVDGGLLGEILAVPGLNLDGTTLASYDGLANVMVTPGGLLEQLGIPVAADADIGTFNSLLAANSVSLGDLLDATVIAAGQDSLLAANALLVQSAEVATGVSDLALTLGSESGGGGLFAEIIAPGTASTRSALDVGISALDVLSTAIAVASADHAIEVPDLSLNLLGLVNVSTRVGVVEPPSIAIGGLGSNGICDVDEDCPTAYTAQVRTHIHVRTDNGLLGSLLAPLLKLDLPIALDVATAQGELQSVCTPDLHEGAPASAQVNVDATILKACVGDIDEAVLFSESEVCDDSLQPMELLNVAGILRLPNNSLQLNGLIDQALTDPLAAGQTETLGNELAVGTLVSDLVAELTGLLFGSSAPTGLPTEQQISSTATQFFNDSGVASNPNFVCNQNNGLCRAQRLNSVRNRLTSTANASGLLGGVLSGLFGAVEGALNPCSGLLFLGGSNSGCIGMIESTLEQSSDSGSGQVSNAVAVLTGLLVPVLDELGSAVLTDLFENVLGLHVGETDVSMLAVECGGTPQLVQ